ncbi:MAG: Holliday junction resolvase RuvX [Actinomycetota bacterium]
MILGIDPGTKRVGVAVADPETRFVRPLEVIDAGRTDPVARIAEIADETGATEIVVGRPVGLSGRPGPAVDRQTELVAQLRVATGVPITEYDERLTSVVAERAMRAGGASAGVRRAKRDAIAAQVMLQDYLDSTK